jgi:tRNA modification GTPase
VSAGAVFSVLTPTGRGAVAVIGVRGQHGASFVDQFFVAANGRSLDKQPLLKPLYGHWGHEDLIVFRRDESSLEIQCHGGSQSVAAIVRDLAQAGCREIVWQDWIADNSGTSIRAEAQIALAEAASFRTAEVLLDQWHGALERELQSIREQLQNGDQSAAEQRLSQLLDTAEFGRHLTQPWRVVIAGKPNVGKSSLINALVGYERAIVFDLPGTTRDVVTASTVIDGWPITLSDTAGLHTSEDELEQTGMELARQRVTSADLVVWVLDAATIVENAVEQAVQAEINELHLLISTTPLIVLNKLDQRPGLKAPEEILTTSATTGEGIDRLLTSISERLAPTVPSKGGALLFTERQVELVKAARDSCRTGNFGHAVFEIGQLLEKPVRGE